MAVRHLEFHKSWWVRIFFILFSLIMLGELPIVLPVLSAMHQADAGMWLYYGMICVPISILSFWLSGPEDISFDLENKTYRRVKGWPFFAKTCTGDWKELWGVYVGQTQGQAAYFCVGVTWWGEGGSMTLERFSNRASAEQFATGIMAELELQKVLPPRNLRPQR